jgi:murein DD-endopeptidase MepM/ murein hydrolase activator NlpD
MPQISSPYGPRAGGHSNFHEGTDFIGFSIGKAVLGGIVTLAGPYTKDAGISVAVDSKDPITGASITIVYMHANAVHVNKGQRVAAGDSLITVGATGNATGPCDHTEIRHWSGGKYTTVNPATEIKKWIQHEAVTSKPGQQTRKVGKVASNGRGAPSTAAKINQVLKPGVVGTFDGYRHAQSVEKNDVWFRGAYNKNWFWSGGFTDKSTKGLPEV